MKKNLTFLIAVISAAAVYIALTPLVTSVIHYLWPKPVASYELYTQVILYDSLPLAFVCAFFGGLINRRHPFAFGIVLVGITLLSTVAVVPNSATKVYFWLGALLSIPPAVAGALLGSFLMKRMGKSEPLPPAWAALTGFIMIALTWTLAPLATMHLFYAGFPR